MRSSFECSSSSLSLSLLSLSSHYTLVALAMKHVDGVSKREGLLLMAMLACPFFLDVFFSSSLDSSSSEESSLS
jgi:hypothetical protein